ncbi:hypothetical protein BD310DRAFT_906507 [Dichomitus squalens]|uniref:Uncharacterized protein n=1 Tax=Dichomitus squalens TaxID=114155 RepID=A0A4Q9PVP8_9APHY|nr:hypothetical protein BD310DRAFT_906507 [Dichomitus squalens]
MDVCPEYISDPNIRETWDQIPDYLKQALLQRNISEAGRPAYHPEGSARASRYLINVRYVSCSSDGHRHRLSETGQPEHASSSPTIDPQLLEEDTELETSSPVHSAPIALARGHRNPLYAARGGLAHRNPGRNVATENNEVDDAPYAPDPLAVKDESDPLSLLKTRHEDLDLVQRQARRIVLNIVGQQFRLVTGVSKHDKWPKWGQQMPGMANHSVIHVTWMNAPNVKLTYSLLRECAKTSFRGFRAAYNSQVDQEKARQCKKNERASRWQNRRNKKSDNLYSVAPRYLELHGVDPGHLVTADLMSDEASGPEDDSNEDAVMEWRRQMAEKAGITGKSDSQLAKLSFFEVIRPNWRSDELTKIHRELAEIHNSSLHLKSLRIMVEHVRDTRRSSDKILGYAPFNFGVNIEWYERMKETDSRFLGDWMKHPDPPGFGENTTPTDDGTSDPSAT